MKKFFEPEIQLDDLQCQRNDLVQFLHEQLSALICRNGRQDDFMIPNKILADHLKIAPQTLHKAYLLLKEDGLLYRQEGKRHWQLNVSGNHVTCLGLILPTSFSAFFPPKSSYGQCHFRICTGLVERAAELGYAVLPLQLPPPDADRRTCLRALADIRRKCRGIIHLGERSFKIDLPLKMIVECADLPQVSLDCVFKNPRICSVSFDARQTARLFVESMRELGHRKFAVIRLGTITDYNLLQSYTMSQPEDIARVFQEEGVSSEDLTIVNHNKPSRESYRREITALLKQDNPPTAIFCRNDDIAIELLQIIRELGFQVPEDFSVIGFNDLNEAETSDPPLTTISNPFLKLGAALADQLHRQIRSGSQMPLPPVRIPTTLIPRGSTGPYLKAFPHP